MFRIRTLTVVEKGDSFIYRLDPRTKLLLLLSIGTIAISLDKPEHLLLLSIFLIPSYLLARFELNKYKVIFLIVLIGLWGMVLSQAMFYRQWPRTVILTIIPVDFPVLGRVTGGLYLYKEGLLYGLAQGLRFATMIASGLLIAWTTEPRDLLLGLVRLKVPYGMAFMFITSVRFLPVLVSELFTVIAVQRLRGADTVRLGRHTLRSAINILTPVLARSVKRAATLGASCESRAFNPNLPRTYLRELRYSRIDIMLSMAAVIAAAAIVVIKTLFWLYCTGILYFPWLRWMYTIAREL